MVVHLICPRFRVINYNIIVLDPYQRPLNDTMILTKYFYYLDFVPFINQQDTV